MCITPDDTMYFVDRMPQLVLKFSKEGRHRLSLGKRGVHSDTGYTQETRIAGDPLLSGGGLPDKNGVGFGGPPFHHPTDVSIGPAGEIYVSDGYSNACVHRYSPDGRLIATWGGSGIGPGEFNLPHNISCDEDGWVYVADRENHRIQVFDGDGRYETEWRNVHRPSGLFMPRGKCPICYVGEIGPYFDFSRGAPNLGPRVSILSNTGELITRLGEDPTAGNVPGKFLSPHSLAVDSHGDLYVGQVAVSAWPSLFPDKPLPKRLRSIEKFERVVGASSAV
jgi:DNA-binding beta-propeller fold protein YncE